MGLLDDAIREHLELKRRHGASEEELAREEREALGPIGRNRAAEATEAETETEPEAELDPEPEDWDDAPAVSAGEDDAAFEADDEPPAPAARADGDDDPLEDTPDFLQETPEHERLWFEQKPPRPFDFDD